MKVRGAEKFRSRARRQSCGKTRCNCRFGVTLCCRLVHLTPTGFVADLDDDDRLTPHNFWCTSGNVATDLTSTHMDAGTRYTDEQMANRAR